MRKEEKYTPEPKEQTRTLLFCDFCQRQAQDSYDWDRKAFHASRTRIEMVVGDVYPEGSFATRTTFDICPDCFEKKLIPLLATAGLTPTIEDEEK